jgi:hypothetical protein
MYNTDMAKTSIFYYTNNLLPLKLFKYTFYNTINLCKENDCELILTSHYPITEKYEEINLNNSTNKKDNAIYNYIVKDFIIPEEDLKDVNIKSYVVGQLPYHYDSIMKQLLLSEEKCSGDNIILMEHDCLYPKDYIKVVNGFLDIYDMTYSSFSNTLLSKCGYFNVAGGSYVLSTCSFRRSVFKDTYKRKLELINDKKQFLFEPYLDIQQKKYRNSYKEEIIINKHLNIDNFLKGQCVLDIKHNFNTDGMLMGDSYFHFHDYWKEDSQYIQLIDVDISDNNKKMWNYGIGKFNY